MKVFAESLESITVDFIFIDLFFFKIFPALFLLGAFVLTTYLVGAKQKNKLLYAAPIFLTAVGIVLASYNFR